MDYSEIRTLVVDDMDNIRGLMVSILRDMGFEKIVEAKDGFAGRESILAYAKQGTAFDLIISDINMPKLSGLELLGDIRSRKSKISDTPFILVSTENEMEIITQAMSLGVSNYIIKPFHFDVVKEKIERTLKNLS
tara:strand:- start:607 stop:1011 length:405 start_codon:yes stop_codon:yes gene_type:complete